jgi:molybdenum cofactor synthesis domain-containing protein
MAGLSRGRAMDSARGLAYDRTAMTSNPSPAKTAAVLIVGDEILSGRIQDANLAYLAKRLGERGIPVREARVVADDEAAIVAAVNHLRAAYDYVFTSGGIGPTHDDITSASVAKAFGLAVVRDPEAMRRLEAHYDPGMINEARLGMADVPEGAVLIDNPVSAAPGFRVGNVHVLAGIPTVLQAMVDGILDGLDGGPPVVSRTVVCSLGEGDIAADLGAVQRRHPGVSIGSYPYFRRGLAGISLVVRGTDAAEIETAAAEIMEVAHRLGGAPRVSEEA